MIRPVGFGDRVLHGTVEKVNQYAEPTGWRQANVKEYKAFVHDRRCVARFAVGHDGLGDDSLCRCAECDAGAGASDVCARPKFYCFVYDHGQWDAREVKAGPTNDKFFVSNRDSTKATRWR